MGPRVGTKVMCQKRRTGHLVKISEAAETSEIVWEDRRKEGRERQRERGGDREGREGDREGEGGGDRERERGGDREGREGE